jgi:hypothetical protein
METQLYALVECLADNYGFDADEAYEFCGDGGHFEKFLVKEKPKKAEPKEKEKEEKASPLDAARKNIALWTKKADALSEKLENGTTKDEEKDQAALDKLKEKLEKENAKLKKLEEKDAPAKKEPAKKEPAKKEPAKKEEPAEKEKRIKRMTPLIKGQLKTAMEGVKLELNDKVQKEFVTYVESMEDDDFRACGLADHMRNFAKSKVPEDEEEEEEVVDNGAGTGLKPVSKPIGISLKELQKLSMTASVEPPGTYWDADNGRFVKGPEAVDDEDIEEITFEDKEYGVGLKSGRVYLEVDGKDVFQGFSGVGKFKAMKRV